MGEKGKALVRIYDPESGKLLRLEPMITRMGLAAVAKKYGVTPSAVEKWRLKIHKPAPRTIDKSSKKLF